MHAPLRKSARYALTLLVLLVAAALTSVFWLPALGNFLVKAGPPVKADIAVVLAGDASGNRILKAGDLVRAGYVPAAIVSGPDGFYGGYESDYAIQFAARHGYPPSLFVPLPNRERSTRTEAGPVIQALRDRGVHKFLLVTSDTHTRRATSIYRELAPDLQVFTVAAPSPEFTLSAWWREREGRKAVLLEWLKSIANVFHL